MKLTMLYNRLKSILISGVFLHLLFPPIQAQVLPEMPQEWLVSCVPVTTNTITVCASGCHYTNDKFQQALNAALPSTTILLEQGVSYTGPYYLPEKTGNEWIIIRTAIDDGQLPPVNQRIDPSYSPKLAKIIAKPTLSAIQTTGRAHHYYFFGLEIASSGFSWNVVAIGNGENTMDALPHDITFDRVYLHGHATLGSRRGIALNGRRIAVVNSWVSDFKEVGFDSQALCAWNGTTFKIVNNYLEGAAENVMFGGAQPSIPNLLCADIEFRNNHLKKPLTWRVGDPTYEGTHWSVKNLFELKNAARIWIAGNIFENSWSDAQTGFAILFTPRTEAGSCPWITVKDVTFEKNIIRHTGSGFNISAIDGNFSTTHSERIIIRDNLMEDINGTIWGGDGRALQVLNGVSHLTVDHNTFINPKGGTFVNSDGPNHPNTDFRYQNNIASNAVYGLHGSGKGVGMNALNFYFPGAIFTDNVLTDGTTSNGGIPSNYPAGNYFPGPMASLDFVDYKNGINGNYRLLPGSPFSGAGSDGRDIGADLDQIDLATAGVISGLSDICDASTAIQLPESLPEIHLTPNPGSAFVYITCSYCSNTSLEMINLAGQNITNITLQKTTDGWWVDTSQISDGVYFFLLKNKDLMQNARWIKLDGN